MCQEVWEPLWGGCRECGECYHGWMCDGMYCLFPNWGERKQHMCKETTTYATSSHMYQEIRTRRYVHTAQAASRCMTITLRIRSRDHLLPIHLFRQPGVCRTGTWTCRDISCTARICCDVSFPNQIEDRSLLRFSGLRSRDKWKSIWLYERNYSIVRHHSQGQRT